MKVYNVTRNCTLVEAAEVADNAWTRLRGLIGHPPLRPGQGMVVTPCRSVHSFFMSFPIDVVFVSADGQVVGLVSGLQPYRIGPIVPQALFVVELPAGMIAETGTQIGDWVTLEQ